MELKKQERPQTLKERLRSIFFEDGQHDPPPVVIQAENKVTHKAVLKTMKDAEVKK